MKHDQFYFQSYFRNEEAHQGKDRGKKGEIRRSVGLWLFRDLKK
jgi:hypothetical protein